MRVLVTRPMPDAARTVARLAERGHLGIAAPLSRIEALPFELPREGFDAIVLTSANAARASTTGALPRDLPTYAVGKHTAEAAHSAGFTQIFTAEGNACGLLHLVSAARRRSDRLLYLAGVERKATLEVGLADAGFEVLVREVYAAVAVAALPDAAAQALAGETIDAVVHYSRRGATIICRLVDDAALGNALCALSHHCLSADCAAPLMGFGAKKIVVADAPNEGALLRTLPAR